LLTRQRTCLHRIKSGRHRSVPAAQEQRDHRGNKNEIQHRETMNRLKTKLRWH
jgi:hypothetical protein